jgi:hypothetical protein
MSKHMRRNICLKIAAIGLIEQICENYNIHPDINENNLKTKHIY